MIADMKIPLLALSAKTTRNKTSIINMTMEIKDTAQLDEVMKKIKKNPSIIEAYRASA